jgi:phosphate transport system substrate-binding protein
MNATPSFSKLTLLAAGALSLACAGGQSGQQASQDTQASTAQAQIKINGAGSSFSNILYTDWMKVYQRSHPDVQLNYQSIGSGAGIKQFTDGTINFGASDAPMTDEQIAAVHGNVLHIPTEMGGVLPTYNLAGLHGVLRFTPDVLADIYLGKITKWNDPRLVAINPSAGLPNQDIAVVHRSDASGTSFIWTDYLTKVSPEWAQKVGKGTSVNWPVGIGGKGNEGVSAQVSQTPGSLGYVELGYAIINKLPVASVRNKAGNFITPTIESVTAAAAGAMKTMGPNTDFRVSITNADGAEAYPISSFTWMLIHKNYQDAALAKALVTYTWWALTTGQAKCGPLGYAPIPEQMRPWLEARLESVTAGGQPVWTGPTAMQ